MSEVSCWFVENEVEKNNVYIVRLKQETKRVLLDLDIMDGLMFHSHVSDEIMGNAQKCVPIYGGIYGIRFSQQSRDQPLSFGNLFDL